MDLISTGSEKEVDREEGMIQAISYVEHFWFQNVAFVWKNYLTIEIQIPMDLFVVFMGVQSKLCC